MMEETSNINGQTHRKGGIKVNRKWAIVTMGLTAALSLAACGRAAMGTPQSGANAGSKNLISGQTAGATTRAANNTAISATGPLPGYLLIADRGNSRLLIVTPTKRIIWQMTLSNAGPHNQNSLGPDDAFLTPDKRHIIVNEEDNHRIAIIDIATKKVVWTYGHSGVPGSAPGYLHTPDDAYQLPDGTVTVADIRNQRILFISPSGHVIKQYGTTLYRHHNPPRAFAAPNGDTPLPDGGMLVTEIGGSYADRISKNGKLVYSVHFRDVAYPSDTQLLPNGNLLVADFVTPGKVEVVTPSGKVVWRWYHTSGPGRLANPSLAVHLPNGFIGLNDDMNHRIIIIDPVKNQIVWQYGHTGVSGTAPGYLNVPDGMDFIPPTWKLPTA